MWRAELASFRPYQRPAPGSELREAVSEVLARVTQEARAASGGPWLLRTGRTVAAEVWEALCARALVPEAWIDHPRRRFVDYDGRLRACPAMLAEAVVFASDPAAVESAEALADEAAERLRPFGVSVPKALLWSVTSVPGHSVCAGLSLVRTALRAHAFLGEAKKRREVDALLPDAEPGLEAARSAVLDLAVDEALFADAARAGVSLGGVVLDAATPNPFTAALGVWWLGFGYGGLQPEGIDLRLRVPESGEPARS